MGNHCFNSFSLWARASLSARFLPSSRAGLRLAPTILIVLLLLSSVFGQDTNPQTQQLKVTKEQLDAIEKEISSLRSEAGRLAAQENSVIASIDQFDVQVELNTREIILLDLKQAKTQQAIDQLNQKYQDQAQNLEQQKVYLSRRLVEAYKLGQLNYLKLLLQVNNAADLLRSSQYVSFLAKDDTRKVQEYRDSLVQMEHTRVQLEQEKRNLALLKADSQSAHDSLLQTRQQKMQLLQAIQDQREVHLNAMGELKSAAGQLQKFFLNTESDAKEETPSGTPITQYKGLLSWPAPGKVTREFGIQKNPRFGTSTISNGVEIAVPDGSDVHAVFEGDVVFAELFKGYGQSVILSHAGGVYTLYAHNSELLVQRGQKVEKGQVIARSGSTGAVNGPSLYFEIREKETPVNPLEWLRRVR
ncbi:MAG: hypothetical protein C5B54_10570 [Acidobacteria bacterium]|nr:MAG: hypothetical protein C5B54_10570 [Acidobacteriota bacterium]